MLSLFVGLISMYRLTEVKAIVLAAQIQMNAEVNLELPDLIKQLETPVFICAHDELIDTSSFEKAGGILPGSNVSVALKVFESHIPAYSAGKHPDILQRD